MSQINADSNDPRSIARNISGIFEAIFPQLVPVTVANFNKGSYTIPECIPVPIELIKQSSLQRSMLFEIAVVITEGLLQGCCEVDWGRCIERAVERQRRYYDAKFPAQLTDIDRKIAEIVANNLHAMLNNLLRSSKKDPAELLMTPRIPGYRWIANGEGDFSIGSMIIEVKCTNKLFSSADYRQIILYWLLSYISSIEKGTPEWIHGTLVNPRLNHIVTFTFVDIVKLISGNRSMIELVEVFSALIEERQASGRLI